MSILVNQHLDTHKQQLRTLGLQIIIHHTHAPVHKQSHRVTVTTQSTTVSEPIQRLRWVSYAHSVTAAAARHT